MTWKSFEPPRDLKPDEIAVLRLLLSRPFVGHDELEMQLASVRVTEELGAGEILNLVVVPDVHQARQTERVPSTAWGKDADGEPIEVLLHVIDGYIAELEFVRYAPGPVISPPAAESLELREL
jgi:hypothetical protein